MSVMVWKAAASFRLIERPAAHDVPDASRAPETPPIASPATATLPSCTPFERSDGVDQGCVGAAADHRPGGRGVAADPDETRALDPSMPCLRMIRRGSWSGRAAGPRRRKCLAGEIGELAVLPRRRARGCTSPIGCQEWTARMLAPAWIDASTLSVPTKA